MPTSPPSEATEERERRLAEHIVAAEEAIEEARRSIAGAKREMRFPLAQSTRLEGDRDRRPVD